MNSAYVLGYSGSVIVPIGSIGGTCGLILAAAISLYANALLARLHEIGGKRHIRYRDLAGHIYGKYFYEVYLIFDNAVFHSLFLFFLFCPVTVNFRNQPSFP